MRISDLSSVVCSPELVALLGSGLRPSASRANLTKIATLVQAGQPAADNLPPAQPLPRSAQLVFVSDFLMPLADIERALRYYGQGGQRGDRKGVVWGTGGSVRVALGGRRDLKKKK